MRDMFRGRWIAALAFLVLGACDSSTGATPSAGQDPAGQYEIKGETVNKSRQYAGQLVVESRGPAYSLAWRLDQGDSYRGMALHEGNVLGGVYWSGGKPDRSLGIVVYRINGGELKGTWVPAGGNVDSAGREDLKGSPNLEGRYEVTVGENPNHRGSYSGYVEMTRNGETYQLRWFLPGPAYVGKGIRVGDVLVVGYSSSAAPGVIAYCMTQNGGEGVWSHGSARSLGTETIRRDGKTDADIAAVKPECVGTGI